MGWLVLSDRVFSHDSFCGRLALGTIFLQAPISSTPNIPIHLLEDVTVRKSVLLSSGAGDKHLTNSDAYA